MYTVQIPPLIPVVTTDSIRRQAYAVSNKRSREEDANFKSSSKAKRPLDNQDAVELEDIRDSYNEGQTGLIEVIPKPSNSFEQWRREFLAYTAEVYAEARAEADCPIAIAEKKEARLRDEEIKKMIPEQYKEYHLAQMSEMISNLEMETWW